MRTTKGKGRYETKIRLNRGAVVETMDSVVRCPACGCLLSLSGKVAPAQAITLHWQGNPALPQRILAALRCSGRDEKWLQEDNVKIH